MIKVENINVFNLDNAIRGMRNPLESWSKNDSTAIELGENDLSLAQRLIRGGPEHAKFLRQIMVSMDITAPLFLWKELDTYKVGTTANSTSTMHKITSSPITADKFSFDSDHPLEDVALAPEILSIIDYCEKLRLEFLETKDKEVWRTLIQVLPNAWNQTRTWTANYSVLRNIAEQRRNHKLKEWKDFLVELKKLPEAENLIFYKGE